MTQVSPVQMGTEAMAQLLALTVSKSVEQATQLAVLNLQIPGATGSGGGSPDGVGQLLDLIA